ncbi:MAG: dual specificity protein phosphatase family protein [Anaerolineae bacterium]
MKIDWIEPGILAANSIPAGSRDIQWLHEQGIRAIVTLTEQPLTVQYDVTPAFFDRLEISYKHIPVIDFEAPDEQQVLDARMFIDQMRDQGKPVFIHCYAGVGRTGTMLHSYYLLRGLSLDEAKAKVLATRRLARFDELSESQQVFLESLALKLDGNGA